MSSACGQMKEINQWKDIINILTGLHKSLLDQWQHIETQAQRVFTCCGFTNN